MVFDCNRGKGGCRPKQVVAAAVPRSPRCAGFLLGDVFLRQTREGVILAQDAEHGFPLSPGRAEGRRDLAYVVPDLKTRCAQLGLQQLGAPEFFITDFGVLPDLAREVAEVLRAAIHLAQDLRAPIPRGLRRPEP